MTDILIVDDEVSIQILLKEYLEPNGYRCTTASNAAEARQLSACKDFELLLCDVNMPGESGLDFICDILPDYPDMAAIMVTGAADRLTIETALAAGAYDYIAKPLERSRILTSVANALHRRSLAIENRRHRNHLEEEIKRRTHELQQSEAKYRELVESANSIILKLDTAGRVTFINEFARHFFGYSEAEILGQPHRRNDCAGCGFRGP